MATKGVSLEALKAVENAGNYFVCTLGQAAEMNLRRPHTFSTINQFLDQQNDQIPNAPAVGFPVPSQNSGQGQDWDHEILCKSKITIEAVGCDYTDNNSVRRFVSRLNYVC